MKTSSIISINAQTVTLHPGAEIREKSVRAIPLSSSRVSDFHNSTELQSSVRKFFFQYLEVQLQDR
jgi:hypothetical protein